MTESDAGMRLLLVEKSEGASPTLAAQLDKAGFLVETVGTSAEAARALGTHGFSAILLDVDLPDGEALTLVRELRLRGDGTPVLMLLGSTRIADRVAALQEGADDVMAKPVVFPEVLARIQALLRRPPSLLGRALKLGNLVLVTDERRAFIGDVPLPLSGREVSVLEMLMRRSGRVVPKKFLEDQLFGLAPDIASNALEVYVHRIRKQLGQAGATVRVHTVRAIGYLIAED